MRYLFIIIGLLLCNIIVAQKSFEGLITYQNDAIDGKPYYTFKEVYFHKKGFYKKAEYVDSSKTKERTEIYHPNDTLEYHHQTTGNNAKLNNTYWQKDLRIKGNHVMVTPPDSFYTIPYGDTILGRFCNVLVLKFKYKTMMYSYDPTIYINPSYFQHHSFDYLNYITQITRSYPLRIITLTKEAKPIEHWFATAVIEKNIRKKVFKIPRKAPIEIVAPPPYSR